MSDAFTTDPNHPGVIFAGPPGGGLYNVVFGKQPIAEELLAILKAVRPIEVGRFRDAWLERHGDELLVRIHTRNGGGNREGYDDPSMSAHPWFVRTEDMEFDSTYADYWFRIDLTLLTREAGELLMSFACEPVDMNERWRKAIADLEATPTKGDTQ
jgi:hypothetical protein